MDCAHEAAIRYTHDQFAIDVYTPAASSFDASCVRVLVCGPPFDTSASSRVDHILTMHAPTVSIEDAWLPVSESLVAHPDSSPTLPRFERTSVLRIRLELAPFTRCGKFTPRIRTVTHDATC